MTIDIKKTLKSNNVTQAEFAEYLKYTRQGLIKAMKGVPKQPIIDSLKIFISKKRGISFDVELEKVLDF